MITITTSLFSDTISFFEGDDDFIGYKIKPLGYEKRNELIDRYHRVNYQFNYTIEEQVILDRVKFSFDQIQTVLGNKLLPSYPIFILSILQNLEETKPINTNQTSYGFCYQSLITYALLKKVSINKDDLDTYVNFLTEFAFNLYETKCDSFSENEFIQFYNNYSKCYIVPSFDEIINKLLLSGLVVNSSDGYYQFCYEYINYYLAARKISQVLHLNRGKDIIKNLCSSLHRQKEANILIFVTHHSKADFLIDEATMTAMLPFEEYLPITLDKEDPYFNLIQNIINQFSLNIIDETRKPIDERRKKLKKRDEAERKIENDKPSRFEDENEDIFQDREIISFQQSLKALEIVGQIIKNGKGSIEKTKLLTMVEELFKTGFRLVSYFGALTNNVKDNWESILIKDVKESDSQADIKNKVNIFFQTKALEFCLVVFSKMIYSLGSKDLRPIYDEAARNLNSPAAKLVSFGIKLYYSKLATDELKKLAEEFSNNKVAFEILKSNVANYVYNNNIEYKQKQVIEDKLKIRFLPTVYNRKNDLK
ncbi:hypothetical protein EZS27_022194 [termite gut metagenome]|uniref:STAND NTPase 4 small alpha/beta domain-containing protein n=1 Tax=termite gut metagenome TaxID=433724 RepID=A0A5J4R5X4_9ZZZZ